MNLGSVVLLEACNPRVSRKDIPAHAPQYKQSQPSTLFVGNVSPQNYPQL
jgi:hypothetical protein